MSDCTKYNTLISAAVDGELGIDEKAQLEEHLRSCGQCRSYLEMMRKMSGALRDSAEEPPEKLSEWIMADVKLHNPRRIFGVYGRYTALAAVICLVVLGAAALRPRLKSGKADAKEAGEAPSSTVAATEAPESGEARESISYGDEEEAFGYVSGWTELPDAVSAEAEADGEPADRDAGDMNDALAQFEPFADSGEQDTAVTQFETSRGYKAYSAIGYEEKFFEAAVIYGAAPDELGDCEILYSDGEQTDYRVPKELMQSLGSEGAFSEIYFNDLLSDYGLVIVLKG